MYKIHLKFVVFGTSGAGKSTLMEILHKINSNITIHQKDTTRNPRKTETKEIHFIIMRDIHAIQQFKYMYPDVKAIYIHTDPKEIPKRLQEREGVDFNERLKRVKEEFNEFVENNISFDHVIVNFWDLKDAQKQIQNIINSYIRKSTSKIKKVLGAHSSFGKFFLN